ncbi:MAG: M20 family peptidase [Deltaproteobacteria bacterium]|nr:M20 family peptidase [Deltaproteobacteria bacterium]
MTKVLLSIGAVVFCIAIAVVLRTAMLGSKQIQPAPIDPIDLDAARVTEKLSRSIQYRTVSSPNPEQFDGEFLGLRRYLEDAFRRVHSSLTREIIGKHSLLFTWKGQDENLRPVLLMGHTDVVPVEPGTENQWIHPPFSGYTDGGYVWGRGALDDKITVIASLEAIESLLAESFRPRRTILLAFGHDEEAGGAQGAAQIGALLESRGIQLDYVLDEGGVITRQIVPGISSPVALIAVSEKGYASFELVAESQGGHSSMPPAQTSVGILSAAISRLETVPFPAILTRSVTSLYDYVGPEMPFHQRMVFANLWLFGPVLKQKLASSPATNAMIRTTMAATMFSAGAKENLLPAKARAVVNVRILPGETFDGTLQQLRRKINDPRIRIAPFGPISEPSSETDVSARGFQLLHRTIRQVQPDAIVAPSLLVGATDSRHMAKLSRETYRFLPIELTSDDLRRYHGIDERVSIENLGRAVRFYVQLIRNSQ